MAYTLTNAQRDLHVLYRGDNSIPVSTDTEWTVALNLFNIGIITWENEKGMLWNELWTTRVLANTGDATVGSADLVYTTPTNLRMLGGFVRTYTSVTAQTYWAVIKPEEADLYKNVSWQHVYLVGNSSAGFSIYFSGQPTVGDTIDYPYYKNATALSAAADKIEMSDPLFAVYFALSKLHEQDGDGDRAATALSIAEEKLASMRTFNAMNPHYQENRIQDLQVMTGGSGFGT